MAYSAPNDHTGSIGGPMVSAPVIFCAVELPGGPCSEWLSDRKPTGSRPWRESQMSVQLNHTIVACRDQQRSASFLTEILGLPAATKFGHFLVVTTANGVSLDFSEADGDITAQHYAFLIGEADFDEIFGRITARGITHWADPRGTRPGEINRNDGGRGVYFEDQTVT